MKLETLAYGILLVGLLIIGLLPLDNEKTEAHYCQIDSISSKLRYEVMPQLDYTYHTSCGQIPAGNTKHVVGDSILIKTIIYEVNHKK